MCYFLPISPIYINCVWVPRTLCWERHWSSIFEEAKWDLLPAWCGESDWVSCMVPTYIGSGWEPLLTNKLETSISVEGHSPRVVYQCWASKPLELLSVGHLLPNVRLRICVSCLTTLHKLLKKQKMPCCSSRNLQVFSWKLYLELSTRKQQ